MSEEEPTTDRHDESDSAQFGDDPHHLADTPFEESACPDCGTYTVKAKGRTDETRCLEHARTHAGITWQSGIPIGAWHPTITFMGVDHTTRRINELRQARALRETQTHRPERTTWQWACIHCLETGTALSADHATAMHKMHVGYACPAAPGITPTEAQHRLQRRAPHTQLYPHTTPPMVFNPETRKAENTKPKKA